MQDTQKCIKLVLVYDKVKLKTSLNSHHFLYIMLAKACQYTQFNSAVLAVMLRVMCVCVRVVCDEWLEVRFEEADIAEGIMSSVVQLRTTWLQLIHLKLHSKLPLVNLHVCILSFPETYF